jgi:hypothetical protein
MEVLAQDRKSGGISTFGLDTVEEGGLYDPNN